MSWQLKGCYESSKHIRILGLLDELYCHLEIVWYESGPYLSHELSHEAAERTVIWPSLSMSCSCRTLSMTLRNQHRRSKILRHPNTSIDYQHFSSPLSTPPNRNPSATLLTPLDSLYKVYPRDQANQSSTLQTSSDHYKNRCQSSRRTLESYKMGYPHWTKGRSGSRRNTVEVQRMKSSTDGKKLS